MQCTAEDALSLFRKWADEQIELKVFVAAGEVYVSANALIHWTETLIHPTDKHSTLTVKNIPSGFLLELPLADVTQFESVTARDVPPEKRKQAEAMFRGDGLTLILKSGVRVGLFDQRTAR
jgi:hypothetical protein